MAKRKTGEIKIAEVLPDDKQLLARTDLWNRFMEKYSKNTVETEEEMKNVCDLLDYDYSDDSNASDVQTDEECDENVMSDIDNEQVHNELVEVVAKRKRTWVQSGLLKIMDAVAFCPNMPSDVKVEKWLFHERCGSYDISQNRETVVTEKNAAGDRMKFYRKEAVTVSRDADDADSLSTIDEKQYILQNRKDRNITSKIKVIQTFKIQTRGMKNAMSINPRLHSISSFPITDENSASPIGWLRKATRSDSSFEAGNDQTLSRFRNASLRSVRALMPPCEMPIDRKKTFKKTAKKKSCLKSPLKKTSCDNMQKFESAAQRCGTVKKLGKRGIQWLEISNIAESSSDESDQVFTKPTRPKLKESSRSKYRQRSSSRSSTTPERSPEKVSTEKIVASPGKVERELVGNFNSICLSPSNRKVPMQQERKQSPKKKLPDCDQSINTTTHSAQTNNVTLNSTATTHSAQTNNVTLNSTATTHSARTNNVTLNSTTVQNLTLFGNRSVFQDITTSIEVYKPQNVQPDVTADARIRITVRDLQLDRVTKARHLEKFQKFDHFIHPNSTILFFPSESEEDEPSAKQTNNTQNEGDLSYDDDDPLLSFKPKSTGRLNLMEYKN